MSESVLVGATGFLTLFACIRTHPYDGFLLLLLETPWKSSIDTTARLSAHTPYDVEGVE